MVNPKNYASSFVYKKITAANMLDKMGYYGEKLLLEKN